MLAANSTRRRVAPSSAATCKPRGRPWRPAAAMRPARPGVLCGCTTGSMPPGIGCLLQGRRSVDGGGKQRTAGGGSGGSAAGGELQAGARLINCCGTYPELLGVLAGGLGGGEWRENGTGARAAWIAPPAVLQWSNAILGLPGARKMQTRRSWGPAARSTLGPLFEERLLAPHRFAGQGGTSLNTLSKRGRAQALQVRNAPRHVLPLARCSPIVALCGAETCMKWAAGGRSAAVPI